MAEIEPNCGLEYIADTPEYATKLARALGCSNLNVRKQTFELLSALCVYNSDGYNRALQTLEQYKELKCERYRFKFVVEQLKSENSSLEYKTTLLAFVNCLIVSTPNLKDRIRIRNEFIGLKLLPILSDLRRCVGEYPDVGVQIDVFEEQRENDESQILDAPYGVDLNSHVDVFYAILRQVSETPQEIPFLNILQHLLRIDPKEAISDIIWDTAETLVHRATLLESRQDATRILRSPSVQSRLCCHAHRSVPDTMCGSRKQSLNISSTSPGAVPPPPPPPPAPTPTLVVGIVPPPPPPPPIMQEAPSNDAQFATPPLSPFLQVQNQRDLSASPEPAELLDLKLPQQETPVPKAKMKTINWNKIPHNKVIGKHNIWSVVARSHQHSPMADLDWSEMEGLFCQQIASSVPSNQSSPRLGRDVSESCDRRKKELTEIILLDGKRSLNVNIFLKQFRCSNEDIIQMIKDGGHDDIGAEKLRGLLKILPEVDEFEMLKAFDGDKTKLGNAEKFLLQLTEVPNYKLRIESMLLKEEFASNMNYLEPSISAMIVAGEDLMTNKPLQEVLYMVLCAGNFLNSGGYAGNAAGVKLSSLQKLTDIRANKPGMNLIHYVALQIEKKRKDLLAFTDDMAILEDATKTTVEQLQNEINMLDSRIKKIKKQVELPSTENDIKNQTRDFLKMAEAEVSTLQHDLLELELVRKSLAEFFCEDAATFKIEDCFKIFHGFYSKFKQAVIENERRKMQEEQANARRRQREEQLAAKKRFVGSNAARLLEGRGENECVIMDSDLLQSGDQRKAYEKEAKVGMSVSNVQEDASPVSGSPIVIRKRLGSYSGDVIVITNSPDENCSPDITPNGSLRRRRSRVPSEEDDSSLMDFLRSSGHESSSKDRKSWGSLDRSWARRARGTKRRPDLLSADFSDDRERPSSPSPVVENKSLLPTPEEEEVKPKAWRQKIEAWLQENEKEEKQSEDLRRKAQRLQTNRRTLEQDFENITRNIGAVDGDVTKTETSEPIVYKRVYSDWKPSVDKTDVVSAMEAIADAQQQQCNYLPDKSVWRKSNLNIGEDDETGGRVRRMRFRGGGAETTSPPLEAIREEEKRKGMIESLSKSEDSDEKLTVYFRSPLEQQNQASLARIGSVTNRRRLPQSESPTKEDLPPFAPRKSRKIGEFDQIEKGTESCGDFKSKEDEALGDGQFERFSSARMTRRYRKPPEEKLSSNNSERKGSVASLESEQTAVIDMPICALPKERKVGRIPVYRPNFARGDRLYSTLPHSFRTSKLDEEESKKKSQDSHLSPSKRSEHDLNDEGFEESQSFISDSLSQTTSSGCNYDGEEAQRPSGSSPGAAREDAAANRYPSLITASSGEKKFKTPLRSQLSSFRQNSGTRYETSPKSSSIPKKSIGQHEIPALQRTSEQRSFIHKRTPPKNLQPTLSKSIERSSSKNSLKSSKSSLTSSTSASTVKDTKSIPKVESCYKIMKSSSRPAKKPFTPIQPKMRTVEPVAKKTKIPSAMTTSFKENSEQDGASFKRQTSTAGFMRPTAASSAKDMTDAKPKMAYRRY